MATVARMVKAVSLLVLLLIVFAAGWLVARTGMGSAADPASLPAVEREFVEKMNGAAMVGRFTVRGREDGAAIPDRYDIYSVDKVGPDLWRFTAKIGESGVTLPVVVTMRFVEDTPIILMTSASIPGMGTFTARVFSTATSTPARGSTTAAAAATCSAGSNEREPSGRKPD